jgi:hypothetical protein
MQKHAAKHHRDRTQAGAPGSPPGQGQERKGMKGVEQSLPAGGMIIVPPDRAFGDPRDPLLQIEKNHGQIRQQGADDDGRRMGLAGASPEQKQIDHGVSGGIHGGQYARPRIRRQGCGSRYPEEFEL